MAGKIRTWERLGWCAALVAVAIAFARPAGATPESASPYQNLGVLARALAHIEMSWVEPADQDALVYGAIRGMVRTLDPHSAFMDPDEYRILTSDTQGAFGGVGVEIESRDGWLTVLSTFDDGPAARAGMRPGDRVIAIEGRDARDMPITDAVRLMRGEPGTRVQVRLRREGEDRPIDVSMVREVIQVEAVEARLLPDGIVWLRLKTFQETTATELRRALDRAVDEAARGGGSVRGVLLDMRYNPGGLLDQAVVVSNEFLRSGVIVSTRARGGQLVSEARATAAGTRPDDWKIVVLVNGYTASAAEIVAGALRDHGRAVIVGTRTFGKGSVQNIIELPDGSALKLTVARYFTPNGTSIQARGIDPDMVVEQLDPTTVRDASGERYQIREESLERHLDSDRDEERSEAREPEPVRSMPRLGPSETPVDGDHFPDDYQARMAYQALRALIAGERR
jgi:carboxyl-terminal processing protease